MKKASSILYLITAILALIAGVSYIIVAIIGFAGGTIYIPDYLIDILVRCGINTYGALYGVILTSGIACLIGAALSFIGWRLVNKSSSIGYHIFIIVISAISFDVLTLLAGIFAIVSVKKSE